MTRALGIAAVAASILGLAPSANAATAIPAVASADSSVCQLPTYGGRYYCGYGSRSWTFANGTEQVFVIGTNFAVWTRWKSNGNLSSWTSLGGEIRHTYSYDDFKRYSCGGNPWLNIVGLDNQWWKRARGSDGTWSAWGHGTQVAC